MVGELAALAATFLTVGDDGTARFHAVRGSGQPGPELAWEASGWHALLAELDPLAPPAIGRLLGRVATLADVGGARRNVLENAGLLATYRQITAIDDAWMPIRQGQRLVAAIALWRPLRSKPWSSEQLRLLGTLQPMVEMAYLAALRAPPPLEDRLPATLTPRQREVARLLAAGAANHEVARALQISPDTVKTHVRAVLAKAGFASRRELMITLRRPAAAP